jgi:hypothetical protein
MSDFFGIMTKDQVTDPKSYANYVQQNLGTPFPTGKQMVILRKTIKDFFKAYPDADYGTLIRLVEWAKARKKKYAHCYALVSSFRYAWSDGYLPELDPNPTKEIDRAIEEAIAKESDEEWRRRLGMASGIEVKTEIYNAWLRKEAFNG